MPRKSPKPAQVPGATPEPSTTADANAQAEQPKLTDEQKALEIAKVAEVKVSDADADATARQLQRRDGELPDASEIDPTKLTRSVRTKQGWVCPAPPAKA